MIRARKSHPMQRAALVAAAAILFAAPALADGDAASGEKIFKQCAVCHTIGEGQPSRMGPNLFNIIGRPVGSAEGFQYSKPYQEAHAQGIVWTPESFVHFIENPRKVYQPTRMVLAIKDEKDRQDLLAFLMSHSPAYKPNAAAEPAKPAN